MDEEASTEATAFAPELFQTENAADSVPIKAEDNGDHQDTASPAPAKRQESVYSSTSQPYESGSVKKRASSDKPKRIDKMDTRHSSKNEGQHTDRRYLCYLCDKLFTRRRSVRDHIAKIHGTKTWEPTRSLEIIVEPLSGEPLGSLEEQVAKGGAAPYEKVKSRDEDDEAREAEPETPAVKNEPSTDSRSHSIDLPVPAPVIGKKRPLPINKKGLAKIRTSTPNKRPRLADSEASTPFRSPSVASVPRGPISKLGRATQSPTSSRAASADPSASPSPSALSTGSSNDEGEIFCICRKGDNHTWMIACDGGCEEWFHGKCVNIRERDGDLIDKYICPNCQKPGLHTTWKRMCRRKDCRKPARVFDNPPSKYCSRECGRMFFVEFIKKGDPSAQVTANGQYIVEMEKPKKRKRKKYVEEKKKRAHGNLTPLIDGSRPHTPAHSDDEKSAYETDSSLDDDMLPNRGGALRASEVKALVEKLKSVEAWRDLGRKPATPPRDSDRMDVEVRYEFDDFEQAKLETIKNERSRLTERGDMLAAREKMLDLIKDRSAKIIDEIRKSNPKLKDLCGYDPRIAWCDDEFTRWWKHENGQQILESGQVGLAAKTRPKSDGDEVMTNGVNGHKLENGYDEETDDVNGDEDGNNNDGGQVLPTQDGICIKNRCQRHGAGRWQKSQLAELRFEQDLVRRTGDKLDKQERAIRERGIVRGWESRGTAQVV